MRQQGVFLRIIALLALIALVLPAGAKVASCMDQAKGMTCCMSHAPPVAKKKVVEQKISDCCRSKQNSTAIGPTISEGKSNCHCLLKSIPVQSSKELNSQFILDPSDISLILSTPELPTFEESIWISPAISSGDSSPPDEPNGSLHNGRAPPVSEF